MIKMFQVETSQEKEERLHEVKLKCEKNFPILEYYLTDEVERLLRDYKQNQELNVNYFFQLRRSHSFTVLNL